MDPGEIHNEAILLRNASTDAQELLELLDRDPIAGERALEKATPEAQGLVAWWLDKENVLPDEFSIFNPRLVARVHRLRASARRPWLA